MASCIFVYIICCNHAHFCFSPMTVAYVHLAMPDTEHRASGYYHQQRHNKHSSSYYSCTNCISCRSDSICGVYCSTVISFEEKKTWKGRKIALDSKFKGLIILQWNMNCTNRKLAKVTPEIQKGTLKGM